MLLKNHILMTRHQQRKIMDDNYGERSYCIKVKSDVGVSVKTQRCETYIMQMGLLIKGTHKAR